MIKSQYASVTSAVTLGKLPNFSMLHFFLSYKMRVLIEPTHRVVKLKLCFVIQILLFC